MLLFQKRLQQVMNAAATANAQAVKQANLPVQLSPINAQPSPLAAAPAAAISVNGALPLATNRPDISPQAPTTGGTGGASTTASLSGTSGGTDDDGNNKMLWGIGAGIVLLLIVAAFLMLRQ